MFRFLSIIVFFIPVVVFAQSGAVRSVSLNEALLMALENSAQIKKVKLDREVLEMRVRDARLSTYPQMKLSLNVDYFPYQATTFMPGEVLGRPEGTFIPVQFGQPYQATGSFHVEQVLYSEAVRRTFPAKNATRQLYDLLIERSEEEVMFQTASVFYQALQTEQLLRAVNANIEQIDALYRMAELQLANGFAIPTDVKRIRVARTNLETQRLNLLAAISALRQTLQFLCGIPFEQEIQPVEPVDNPSADSSRWQSMQMLREMTIEYRLLNSQIDLNRIQYKSTRAGGWPSLSVYASGFLQGQRTNFNFFDPSARWYPMLVAGFKLDMPLFDGFRKRRKANLLKMDGLKLMEDRRQLEMAKAMEFRQASEQFDNALRLLQTQEENVELAREVAEKLTLQYKEGVSPLTDLLNAQTALSEAETNYWQQVFGYKIAVLNLLKVAGRLELLQQ